METPFLEQQKLVVDFNDERISWPNSMPVYA